MQDEKLLAQFKTELAELTEKLRLENEQDGTSPSLRPSGVEPGGASATRSSMQTLETTIIRSLAVGKASNRFAPDRSQQYQTGTKDLSYGHALRLSTNVSEDALASFLASMHNQRFVRVLTPEVISVGSIVWHPTKGKVGCTLIRPPSPPMRTLTRPSHS